MYIVILQIMILFTGMLHAKKEYVCRILGLGVLCFPVQVYQTEGVV